MFFFTCKNSTYLNGILFLYYERLLNKNLTVAVLQWAAFLLVLSTIHGI